MPISEHLLRLEIWRKRFIEEGFVAIDAFVLEYPKADKKQLKSLIQKAQAMHHKHGTPRFLLRHIRELDAGR